MFTGLVEELGVVRSVDPVGDGVRIRIAARTVVEDAEIGSSIAVNGCCLTVVELDPEGFAADAVPETLRRTALGALGPGAPVNLERSLAAGDRMGGHIVLGHVDATTTVHDVRANDDGSWWVVFDLPPAIAPYVVEKGSIAVDGVSLTVAELTADTFAIALIPHTAAVTTLGRMAPGSVVQLEADCLAKHVERLLGPILARHQEPRP
ncbi:MAG: riboflavin synthase [Acidimicrobiales bacterium]|jgi:riboflavin synthase|nr:riboflavin synthase [Acidimicrobiales bacterium]